MPKIYLPMKSEEIKLRQSTFRRVGMRFCALSLIFYCTAECLHVKWKLSELRKLRDDLLIAYRESFTVIFSLNQSLQCELNNCLARYSSLYGELRQNLDNRTNLPQSSATIFDFPVLRSITTKLVYFSVKLENLLSCRSVDPSVVLNSKSLFDEWRALCREAELAHAITKQVLDFDLEYLSQGVRSFLNSLALRLQQGQNLDEFFRNRVKSEGSVAQLYISGQYVLLDTRFQQIQKEMPLLYLANQNSLLSRDEELENFRLMDEAVGLGMQIKRNQESLNQAFLLAMQIQKHFAEEIRKETKSFYRSSEWMLNQIKNEKNDLLNSIRQNGELRRSLLEMELSITRNGASVLVERLN